MAQMGMEKKGKLTVSGGKFLGGVVGYEAISPSKDTTETCAVRVIVERHISLSHILFV